MPILIELIMAFFLKPPLFSLELLEVLWGSFPAELSSNLLIFSPEFLVEFLGILSGIPQDCLACIALKAFFGTSSRFPWNSRQLSLEFEILFLGTSGDIFHLELVYDDVHCTSTRIKVDQV